VELRLTTVSAPKGAYAQIKEDTDNQGCSPERPVVAGMGVSHAFAPERRGEDDDRQKKQYPSDLEPEDTADPAERA